MTDKHPHAKKVLLVDDDPMISEVVRKKIESEGYEALLITNPREAIFQAEQMEPDLIITDLMMTRLSGEDLLKEVKTHKTLKTVPVLVFSNKDIENEEPTLIENGAAKCLVKADTSLEKLTKVIKELTDD